MIDLLKENAPACSTAFHVGIQEPGLMQFSAHEHLHELKELTKTLGMSSSGEEIVFLRSPQAQLFIGSGKAQEIAEKAKAVFSDCIVLDCELSPSQQRNWEKIAKLPVIDRQEIIIDIFARRALTREAVIQVELARMQYMLPRLARAWGHLSRQKGGAMGTRGEGEQQIEADRRIVKNRIAHYQRELKQVKKNRESQRKLRERNLVPHAAIVGYTNAGKSSILNRLCGATVLVEDKLFATLDPTTRQLRLPENRSILLTDTVGFIRKLPHTLVEAFKSTLEEAALADFLIHVVDMSDPYFEDHRETTLSVLAELGAKDKEILTVFNKTDVIDDIVLRRKLESLNPDAFFVSAVKGDGIDKLLAALSERSVEALRKLSVAIPPDRHDMISFAHRNAEVISSQYADDGSALMTILISSRFVPLFTPFCKGREGR